MIDLEEDTNNTPAKADANPETRVNIKYLPEPISGEDIIRYLSFYAHDAGLSLSDIFVEASSDGTLVMHSGVKTA
jgi:hypothetical protein